MQNDAVGLFDVIRGDEPAPTPAGGAAGARFIPVSSNQTAVTGARYLNLANATYTDPTPASGANYEVFVRNGTATIGGTAYAYVANRPILVVRSYHSGAWANQVLLGTDNDGASYDEGGVVSVYPDSRLLYDDAGLQIIGWENTSNPAVAYISGANPGEVQVYKQSTSTATSGTDTPTVTYGDSNMANLAASLAATLTLNVTSWATAAWPGSRMTYFSRSGVTALTFTATGFTVHGAALTALAALASVEYQKVKISAEKMESEII
jgi:hypothetical protein